MVKLPPFDPQVIAHMSLNERMRISELHFNDPYTQAMLRHVHYVTTFGDRSSAFGNREGIREYVRHMWDFRQGSRSVRGLTYFYLESFAEIERLTHAMLKEIERVIRRARSLKSDYEAIHSNIRANLANAKKLHDSIGPAQMLAQDHFVSVVINAKRNRNLDGVTAVAFFAPLYNARDAIFASGGSLRSYLESYEAVKADPFYETQLLSGVEAAQRMVDEEHIASRTNAIEVQLMLQDVEA